VIRVREFVHLDVTTGCTSAKGQSRSPYANQRELNIIFISCITDLDFDFFLYYMRNLFIGI